MALTLSDEEEEKKAEKNDIWREFRYGAFARVLFCGRQKW